MYCNEWPRRGGDSEIAMLARARRVSRPSGQRGTTGGAERLSTGKSGAGKVRCAPRAQGSRAKRRGSLRDTRNTFSPATEGGTEGKGRGELLRFALRRRRRAPLPQRCPPPARGDAMRGAEPGRIPAAPNRGLRKGAERGGEAARCAAVSRSAVRSRSSPIAIRRGVTWKQAPKNSRANDERRPGDRAERSGGGEEEVNGQRRAGPRGPEGGVGGRERGTPPGKRSGHPRLGVTERRGGMGEGGRQRAGSGEKLMCC